MKVSLETKIQIDFVDWCRNNYPHLLVMRIPNDDKRTKVNGYISKRMGTVAGVPDIFIPQLFLWIEFKGQGKTRASQDKAINQLEEIGYTVAVCYSAAEAIEVLNHQLNNINMFKISGKVMEIGAQVNGQSKSGNSWSKQHFVIETEGQYPKSLKFDVWGKSIEMLGNVSVGDMVEVNADAESRAWQDKWFTDLKAFRIEKSTQQSTAPVPAQQSTQQSTTTEPTPAQDEAPDEDLPF